MEEKEKKQKKKRAPKAYLIENGVRMELPKHQFSGKLSAYGLWIKEHPNGVGKILDMRAVMK
ncbi:MAG: hypothetical protein LBN93_03300 [Candidatus Symbiothrix sp.]|jgi:hypothetical protein|nr:hypothetical protein [Candidatus Symbiothrix sp.]